MASLNRVKDQPTLLRALRALRDAGVDFTLDVVGEDTLHGQVQALTRELGLAAQVRYHGFLTQRELRPLVEAADLQLVSSRHEAGPFVLLEAAVAGVPTVGTAVGQLADWAPEAALASPVGDAAALARNAVAVLADEAAAPAPRPGRVRAGTAGVRRLYRALLRGDLRRAHRAVRAERGAGALAPSVRLAKQQEHEATCAQAQWQGRSRESASRGCFPGRHARARNVARTASRNPSDAGARSGLARRATA